MNAPTPSLDALTAEGRRWLAEHFDELAGDDLGHNAQTAAVRAAEAVCAHPWADPAAPHPNARLQLLLDAFVELRDLRGDGADALLARVDVAHVRDEGSLLATLVEDFGRDSEVDAATLATQLSAVYGAVGAFLLSRSGGLAEDARVLHAGAAEVDRGPQP